MTNSEIVNYIKKSFDLKNQGFYKPAIEMLYKALALDSENIEILVQLSQLYKLLNNFQKAIYYLGKVLDINANHIDGLCLLEEIYLEQNNLSSAKDISQKIYDIRPTSENLVNKIKILNKIGDYSAVLEIEKKNKDLDADALYELSCAHYGNYEIEKSLKSLESAYLKDSKNEKIMLKLAKIYYEYDNIDASKKIFLELEKNNNTPEVSNYIGLFYLNENKIDSAIDYFKKAQKGDSKNAEFSYNLASAYFLKGWLDEAIICFNTAIMAEPDNINYHYSLAYAYYQKKLYEKASIELNAIYEIEQNHTPSNVLKALLVSKKGDLLEAKTQLENIIKYRDADDFAYFALGQINRELSSIDTAKKQIEKAIELNPNSLNYINELMEIEFEQKKYEKAMELAERIISINEKYIAAHITIAKIKYEQNDFDSLFDIAQEIIELDSNCPDGYYYNAIALFEQNDKDFAIESLKKSISLDLYNANLYAKMSEFYQELGDFKQAYGWAKEAAEIDERNYKFKWLCAKLAATLKNEAEATKYYSLAYRLSPTDNELSKDYSEYLKSQGKTKQAEKIFKS